MVKSYPLGFVFCSRIPTTEELVNHYKGYSRKEYLSPVTVDRYNDLLDEFEKYRKTGKILDVGCGIGYFLTEAKKRGWEVHGTEFTDEAIEKCEEKGINMHKGKLNPDWFSAGAFDVITSFEVIEHINNPIEELTNISTILRKGGLFYFTTPNFNAIERFILKDAYNVIAFPEHLSYYTKKTIHYLMEKTGFTRKKLRTTGVSLTRIRTSLGKSEEAYVSEVSSDEIVRVKIDKNPFLGFLKKAVNSLLDVSGTGSSLKGWYIKK